MKRRRCPKCMTGIMRTFEDQHGCYADCLMCGYVIDLDNASSGEDVKRESTGRLYCDRLGPP